MGEFFEDDKSLYKYDMRARTIISNFADKYFYPYLLGPHEAIFRTAEKSRKEQGIDLVIRNWWERKDINVCEKASSHYINSGLSNFAFEIGTGLLKLPAEKLLLTASEPDTDSPMYIRNIF